MPSETPDPNAETDPARPLGDVRTYTRRRRTSPRVLIIAILGAAAITVGGAALMALILAAIANSVH